MTAEEANRLCDKEEQNKAFADKNHPSQDELSFLTAILHSIKLDAERKSFDWTSDFYSETHKKMLPRICFLLKELGYGASAMSFKDDDGVEYCQLLVTWV